MALGIPIVGLHADGPRSAIIAPRIQPNLRTVPRWGLRIELKQQIPGDERHHRQRVWCHRCSNGTGTTQGSPYSPGDPERIPEPTNEEHSDSYNPHGQILRPKLLRQAIDSENVRHGHWRGGGGKKWREMNDQEGYFVLLCRAYHHKVGCNQWNRTFLQVRTINTPLQSRSSLNRLQFITEHS